MSKKKSKADEFNLDDLSYEDYIKARREYLGIKYHEIAEESWEEAKKRQDSAPDPLGIGCTYAAKGDYSHN